MAAAAATRLFKRGLDVRRRNRIVTVALALLSPAVAAAAVSLIAAGSFAPYDRSLLTAAAGVLALSCVAVRFPRAVGFPCVVGFGAAVALVGYCVLGLPPARSRAPIGLVVMGEGGTVSVRFDPPGGETREAAIAPDPAPIRAEALLVGFDRLWPVAGGTERLALRSVRFGEGGPGVFGKGMPLETLIDSRLVAGGKIAVFPGIRAELLVGFSPENPFPAGSRLGIYRSSESLQLLP